MKTAEGEFVYAVNGKYFARTPVKTGVQNDDLVEIKDGLYAGDQIVISQVTSLWMTELQTLRAGQSCCAGH
jgi:multidrug efflux pump subunit AcrA (membrane-fusion protein)